MRALHTVTLAVLATAPVAAQAASPYEAQIQEWRRGREERLRADDGWLTVVGLFWLREGENAMGSEPGSPILLPASAPRRAGVLVLRGDQVTARLEKGATALLGTNPVDGPVAMSPDTSGDPTVLRLGSVTIHVIRRGNRLGVRLKDSDSPARRAFAGLDWFPVNPSYRVTARYVAYPAPKTLEVPNVLGDTVPMPSPGYVTFRLGDRELRLDPVVESDDELFFIFRDETSAKETYGAGRFLYTEGPKDGKVVLDFNKAYSPPCAFTRFATCPLPPRQNRLPFRIEAGEKRPHGH